MTRIDKLYTDLLANPGKVLPFRDFIALVEAFGFRHSRTKGSHRSYVHSDCPKLLVVQPKGKDAKRYQVREFLDMIEEYGLHRQT
jgi:predicted RNA binding protein YcfA (HicA-like mRNA interferase family)